MNNNTAKLKKDKQMCGRYFIDTNIEDIKQVIDEIERRYPGVIMKEGEIFPTETVPIIKDDGPAPAKWGYPGFKKNSVIFNARAESADEKPMFKKSMNSKRCVVPTSGFFEWTKTKIKYFFELPDESVLYLAGLYEYYDNELCMVVLTHDANASMKEVHHRMPVILTGDQLTLWLNETDEAKMILEMNSPKLKKEKW